MANRSYMSSRHHLLSGYSPLSSSRSGVNSSSRSSPPEFSYDTLARSHSERSSSRESTSYSRAQPSSTNTSLTMAYPNVNEFPYGLSGVQMPTYNFGSELYNYVSNGFPRKSRMCTFCNKVFTRSTTRRYHERRCPLLRASNSLAKNEENNTAAAVAAAAALKEQQQRHKEAANASANQLPSAPRTVNSSSANITSHAGSNLPSAPTPASPPPQTLHPAYPTSFPVTNPINALGSSPSRGAASAYSYAHYGSHFYNSISAAAIASLDQNSNTLQSKKESDSMSWSSSPSPSSKNREHSNSILGLSALSKSFNSDSGMDLTAKYCSDFSIRSQPPVFPPSSLRGIPLATESPEPGETKSDKLQVKTDRRRSPSPHEYKRLSGRERDWPSPNNEKMEYPDKITVANISGARLKMMPSTPPPLWNNKAHVDRSQEEFSSTNLIEEDEEDEEEDEDNEEEVAEDQEQFNESHNEEDIKLESDALDMSQSLVCQYCQKSFADSITRKAHEALHSQTKSFACSLCTSAFHCAYSLRIHFLRHHNEGPYKCKHCSATFEDIMALKKHLVSEHTLPKQEICSLKYFSLLDNSEAGQSMPHNMALSDGEHDSKESNSLLQRRSADSLPDVLKDSDSTTKKLCSDELEEQAANGESVAEETEVCRVCNKSFAKSFIRFHERSHAVQKPYACPLCNKRFGYKNNMKSHMKLHQGLKPYQCQICGARFTRGSTLRRHGRRHDVPRNAMLDFVLYNQTSGHTQSTGPSTKAITNTSVTTTSQRASTTAPSPHYANHSRKTPTESNSNFPQNQRHSLPPPTNLELENYVNAARQTPPKNSPQNMVSPRLMPTHLTTNSLASPMAGSLAAVAAANLFAYPAAAAPHLYQFYASTNQLINYSAYAAGHSLTPSVQSDALNLSIGKRKSVYDDETNRSKEKYPRRSVNGSNGLSPVKKSWEKENIKVEAEEPGEMTKREGRNPFIDCFSPKKEKHINTNGNPDIKSMDTKEELKISTEDFGAQVNICCPSPLVQSSTGSLQNHGSSGSPVGSSCNGNNIHSHASPSGLSSHSSPANSTHSAPSPSNINDHHLQELLLSLLTSGRMFRCSYCEIYFTEYAMFRLHQKYHQSDTERPFLCSVCGEDCKDKTYFTVHLSEHLGLGAKGGLA
uniref:C2H2-type domain-containing protein n=1 Tax=Biomphalaria glabrata TaxID=6526 RepID=A0A2C9K476_BIOGL